MPTAAVVGTSRVRVPEPFAEPAISDRNAPETFIDLIFDSVSPTGENGAQFFPIAESSQVHERIRLPEEDIWRISQVFVNLYAQGLSINDIRKQTGKAKSTIRGHLIRAGIEMRPNQPVPPATTWRSAGKRNIRPPYGFCYFQGKVVPDQREFPHLLLIHRLWKSGVNPNAIAEHLNAKKIAPRKASAWNRNSVVNILARFKSKKIILKGDQYELR